MDTFLDAVRSAVRNLIRYLARFLNAVSGGHLSANAVTIIGLFAHVPIAWLIATRHNIWAAGLLVIFGLFDVLDGELARLQGKASSKGMLLDSVTDRMKEVLLYMGVSYAIIANGGLYWAVWAVAACGAALLVSYINAWGEVVVSAVSNKNHKQNKSFRSGLMGFEVRMVSLIVGLLANRIIAAVVIIAVLSLFTALQRIIKINRSLHNA